ncbi:response regulator transcription factor [Actinoallomurus spadix]|uniref:Response regulator transcription factor n=1 Tax=Actinoallomurus spadix TaxID=79912 RepID=A0ABN0W1N5_9ACTN|nr:response regulator transcription factor [Actinoallomurus spadix]MCO5985385.1 response regulator transcription factor [Actinoallomurus spadix]
MVRVLLAEDVRILRDALVTLLDLAEGIDVVAAVESGPAVLPRAAETAPDVAVIDIDLPGKDGLTVAAELHDRVPACRTLILTGLGRPGYLRRALDAGITGFMLKDASAAELADAIRKVAEGHRMIDPQLALAALEFADNPLTTQESRVLGLIADGANLPEIGDRLSLSQGTVRNYLASAVSKLGARNRVDAVRIAVNAGWL